MKKAIVIILIIVMFLAVSYAEHRYTREDCVAIYTNACGVIFEDKSGFTWVWEEQGFEVGDVVDLKMHDNLTSGDIYDDIIVKVIRVD